MISGIVHVLKSGARWVDAPTVDGPRKTLYNRYVRWAAKGVWVNLFHSLARCRRPFGRSSLIDSSAVKAHRSASGGKRMARPVASGFCPSGLISLLKRIRPSGLPLAKMEIRASRSS